MKTLKVFLEERQRINEALPIAAIARGIMIGVGAAKILVTIYNKWKTSRDKDSQQSDVFKKIDDKIKKGSKYISVTLASVPILCDVIEKLNNIGKRSPHQIGDIVKKSEKLLDVFFTSDSEYSEKQLKNIQKSLEKLSKDINEMDDKISKTDKKINSIIQASQKIEESLDTGRFFVDIENKLSELGKNIRKHNTDDEAANILLEVFLSISKYIDPSDALEAIDIIAAD